jgi:hypothetical protein
MAGVLIIVSAFSIGFATFIENDFGTIAAKALVYNALWFEIMIGIVFVNLAYNSINIKPWRTRQWSVFLFHISFLLIIIGAALTRFVGYEGIMGIREGITESSFLSEHTYIIVEDEEGEQLAKKKVMFSSVSNDEVQLSFDLAGESYKLNTYSFVPDAIEFIDDQNGGEPIIELMLKKGKQFQGYSINEGQVLNLEGVDFGFNSKNVDVQLSVLNNQLYFQATDTVEFFDMMTGLREKLSPDSSHLVRLQKLYTLGNLKWVFNQFYSKAKLAISSSTKGKTGLNGIHFAVSNQNGETVLASHLLGTSGYINPKTFVINGESVKISYGSEKIQLK